MAFTDKQLEHAKAELLAARRMEWPFPDADDLIACLEAAENICKRVVHDEYCKSNSQDSPCNCKMPDLLKVWRKSKGE
jgi:hypothetical protein